ncbi:glycosyltransferase family 4 protein [Croceicoccus naphthovorans]|uniref:Uncharacterized protein n=1 Tax=Croceicoccus naphthovorans TaxID=1348774 RepID=A0A0G3XJC5_9SPHN|nr:glycosyltransferase family 4 protein [Croceicoccus naphthovorans]AKM11292.1 hypothetical protein AB433_17010 [Croceicoccus naphthovorans]MBB3989786.1 glycosyltransferase involved in cell wall biosynthesis [Croceicoccus naphthovorans]
MKILLVDYSGHPFQVQLSRALARRGHSVRHVFSASFQTPHGRLSREDGDPPTFEIASVSTKQAFAKASFVKRRAQEIEIGHALADQVRAFAPDVVLSSNVPLDAQRGLQRATHDAGARFVFWLQDIYSEAITRVVTRKFPVIGHLVARIYDRLEYRLLRRSEGVVAISPDFLPILAARGVSPSRTHVVENWAPLDELPIYPRDNDWAAANMPADALRFVYSGTIGYKHDPMLLLQLAEELGEGVSVLVFSQGEAADALARAAADKGVANLSVRPWVPFGDLPRMLGGADVLVAMIEPEAGIYSVPSKILTYLAAGRPILASMPSANLAARNITGADAGMVVEPGDRAGMVAAARELAASAERRRAMGDNARQYAKRTFDIDAIADRFETILMPQGTENQE